MLPYPLVGCGEVVAVYGLVAHTPDDDTRAVAVYAHVVLVALQNLSSEHRLEGWSVSGIITESVTLLIGFSHEIDTQFVTHMIPLRVVGIVAGAHGVHVEAFHQHDVL